MQLKDREIIDGSGLFHFKSSIDDKVKLDIVRWYKSLSKEHQEYVDILRTESSDDTEFFCSCDC